MSPTTSEELATAYFKVLTSVDWKDPVVVSGLREGLNKFLSNAYLASLRGATKYHKTHWISDLALAQLKRRDHRKLIFEHMVPKTTYIQRPCEKQARAGLLTIDFIAKHLSQYWHLATITKSEDDNLSRMAMPMTWDLVDVHARYQAAGLVLVPNPYFSDSFQPTSDS